jgi:hypothetical protein
MRQLISRFSLALFAIALLAVPNGRAEAQPGIPIEVYTFYGCGVFQSCHTATVTLGGNVLDSGSGFLQRTVDLRIMGEFSGDPGRYAQSPQLNGRICDVQDCVDGTGCLIYDQQPQYTCIARWGFIRSVTFVPRTLTFTVGYGIDPSGPQSGATAAAYYETITLTTTPEPGTWALLSTGLAALGAVTYRRRKSV